MKIASVSASEAWRRCADAGYLGAWRALVAGETKLALVQAPEFALPWYRAYAGVWEPLLVEGRADDGELLALLPLARRADGRLAHAGAEQAEYHGWLARAGRDTEFLVPALESLRAGPGFGFWAWRWLSPGSPTEFIDELAARGFELLREERPAPIWDLAQKERLAGLLQNRSTRAKLNRFKKRGEFRLERVRDAQRTRQLLAELARQCDFRQEVAHGVRPFADDPRKLEFFAARQEFPAANHFSVLWCGDEPLAFHFGATDGRTCLYGLASYAPHESKNSPGTLLLLELARALAEEGFATLDLTPGTDPYKQRFATGQRQLTRLSISATRGAGWRARAKQVARRALLGGESAPEARQARVQRLQRGLREVRGELARRRLGGLARRAAGFVLERRELLCFAPPLVASASGGGAEVREQAWAELLGYAASRPYPSRRVLLAEALERFSDGGVLYSAGSAGRLARLGWRLPAAKGELATELTRAGWLAQGGELLRLSPPLLEEQGTATFLALAARLLSEREGASSVLCVEHCRAPERAALEAAGLRALGRARLVRLLRAQPAWQVEPFPVCEGAS